MPDNRYRVSAAIWPWRETKAEPDSDPRPARKTVLVEVSIMSVVCLLFLFLFKKPLVAAIVASLAGIVLVGGLWCPPLYRGFKQVGRWLGKGTGVGLSWLLLVPFFYLCFLPARLILLLARKDPMQRRFESDAESYWSTHRPLPEPESYRNQY